MPCRRYIYLILFNLLFIYLFTIWADEEEMIEKEWQRGDEQYRDYQEVRGY